jgi:hypothetical protein
MTDHPLGSPQRVFSCSHGAAMTGPYRLSPDPDPSVPDDTQTPPVGEPVEPVERVPDPVKPEPGPEEDPDEDEAS